MYACCSVLITIVTYVLVLTSATLHVIMYMFVAFEVRGTQPLICVGCSVHYWVTCAINKGGFFEIAFSSSSTHICHRFGALAYILPHFDALTRGDSCVLGVHLSKVCKV